jgi:hypothetical protein
MDESNALDHVRFLRDVVAKTQPPTVNRYWSVTLMWGCVATFAYALCFLLARAEKFEIIPWVWPLLLALVAFPLHWYLIRKVRASIEASGVRRRFRKDLMCCWISITGMGLLWTAAMVISGAMATHWYILSFLWGSLYFVGYVMNGVLISTEWFWAAAVLLASMIAAFLAGPDFYWLPGLWSGGTLLLAGILGRRNANRQPVEA